MKRFFSKISSGFTLVEILVVIIIILILAGLVLSVSQNVIISSKKSRAASEVAAIDMALSRFQVDNGFYPTATNISTNANNVGVTHYYMSNPASNPPTNAYMISGRALFLALMGRTTYDYSSTTTNTNTSRQYYNDLKASQVGNESVINTSIINPDPTVATTYTTNTFTAGSYIIDPFQNAYGYFYNANSTTTGMSMYNVTAPDIWSTSGETNNTFTSTTTYIFLRWMHNWPQNATP